MIPVSEQFLSIQGEGPTSGQRAIFLRTHACNLLCGAGRYANGSQWTCDTIPVFTKIQNNYSAEDLLADWNNRGWIKELSNGTHLVITGGEPLLPERQVQMIPFLKLIDSHYLLKEGVFIECETNGTFVPTPDFSAHIDRYNVSPKLASSGMPKEMRLNAEVVQWHCQNAQSIFKFVITSSQDIQEMISDYITPYAIPRHRVWLMPGAATRSTLIQLQPSIAQLAQEHGFNFCSRLHILLYDQATGV